MVMANPPLFSVTPKEGFTAMGLSAVMVTSEPTVAAVTATLVSAAIAACTKVAMPAALMGVESSNSTGIVSAPLAFQSDVDVLVVTVRPPAAEAKKAATAPVFLFCKEIRSLFAPSGAVTVTFGTMLVLVIVAVPTATPVQVAVW